MSNEFGGLPPSKIWHVLVDAAVQAMESEGYELERKPGRGRSNIWRMKRDGQERLVSIRTTRDRWIAFPPRDGGWRTLDDVEVVAVAAVDDVDDPQQVEVYLFPAGDVRERFTESYNARVNAGQTMRDEFGMWINLDHDDRGLPASVGSGLADHYEPIAVYPMSELMPADEEGNEDAYDREGASPINEPQTIADVLSSASAAIAHIAGIDPQKVKLDLRIEG